MPTPKLPDDVAGFLKEAQGKLQNAYALLLSKDFPGRNICLMDIKMAQDSIKRVLEPPISGW